MRASRAYKKNVPLCHFQAHLDRSLGCTKVLTLTITGYGIADAVIVPMVQRASVISIVPTQRMIYSVAYMGSMQGVVQHVVRVAH